MDDPRRPDPWDDVVATDGEAVRISYSGSACRDDVRVDVDESDHRVRITLHEVVIATGCHDVAVRYEVEVTLDTPLGDRELVDGSCGYPRLSGRPACASAVRGPTG